jgi:bacteriorhodopsin
MARGQGVIEFGGQTIYYARYIDWLFTTPLLLLTLLTIALPPLKEGKGVRERIGLIGAVLFANIAMIVTGAIANFSTETQDIAVWYVASCLWFLIIIWLLFGEVKRYAETHNKKLSGTYMSLLWFLSAVWIWYPVVWLLGESGYSVINTGTEAMVYAILDVTAKAVFGTVALLLLLDAKKND